MSALYSHATGSRPVCVHCGEAYGRRHTHEVTLRWEEGEPEPRYEGYLTVVKRSAVRKFTRAVSLPALHPFKAIDIKAQPNARDIEVWDGKSWDGGYEPFCTLRCALSYARKAYAGRTAR
jgi:hypothetical protein